MHKYIYTVFLFTLGTVLTGCATTIAPPRTSGYYSHELGGGNYVATNAIHQVATFNGAPVAENRPTMIPVFDRNGNIAAYVPSGADPRVQQDWVKLGMAGKKLDHKIATDQWKMAEKSADNVIKRVDRGVRTGERVLKALDRFGR